MLHMYLCFRSVLKFLSFTIQCLCYVDIITGSNLKPGSREKEYSGLKWERVKVCPFLSVVNVSKCSW